MGERGRRNEFGAPTILCVEATNHPGVWVRGIRKQLDVAAFQALQRIEAITVRHVHYEVKKEGRFGVQVCLVSFILRVLQIPRQLVHMHTYKITAAEKHCAACERENKTKHRPEAERRANVLCGHADGASSGE